MVQPNTATTATTATANFLTNFLSPRGDVNNNSNNNNHSNHLNSSPPTPHGGVVPPTPLRNIMFAYCKPNTDTSNNNSTPEAWHLLQLLLNKKQ